MISTERDAHRATSETERLRVAVESIAGAPFSEGNDITVLRNGGGA